MAKKKSRSKFWFAWYPVAGGRGPKYIVGSIFHKKLYPTIKHLPSERRVIDVFADLRR